MQLAQVDPGAEDPSPPVARVGHHPAAEDADAGPVVQQDQVDGRLQVVDQPVVLGVQAVLVVDRQMRGAVAQFDEDRAQVEPVLAAERVLQVQGPGGRSEHRVHQMPAGVGGGQQTAEEDALVDLQALLLRLRPGLLNGHQLRAGDQPREALGSGVGEPVQAQWEPAAVGEDVVDLLGVVVHQRVARPAAGLDGLGREVPLPRVARVRLGQRRDRLPCQRHVPGQGLGVLLQHAGDGRQGLGPGDRWHGHPSSPAAARWRRERSQAARWVPMASS